jgi:asparagine synthase (glutamine-hydrolysing)
MCGVAGFLDRSVRGSNRAHHEITRAMTDTIRHRGPDDEGVWTDPEAGIALGHRRLSILDLSPEGHQPMHSANGTFVMVFNGEIYNFTDLRRELEALGHRFRGHSDTEIMLAAFEQWGVRRSVERFNGMFAFAVWDRRERILWLSRDRLGKKPLYYGWTGKTLLFGSELKAFHAHPDFDARIDRNVLALYLRHGYIPAPFAIYEGVRKLPAGGILAIRPWDSGSNSDPEVYWSVLEAARKGLADPLRVGRDEALSLIEPLLTDAVKIRMIADVPLGAFLSGGIDSSVVVALMQRLSNKPVRTFSIGFHERSHDEAVHAKAVASWLGTDHTEFYVEPQEALQVIDQLPEMFDEPFADSSQIPTFLVASLARRHVTVALSGDGGDELFGGYSTYDHCLGYFDRNRRWPTPLRQAFSGAVAAMPDSLWRAVPGTAAFGIRMQHMASILGHNETGSAYRAMLSHWEFPARIVSGAHEPSTLFLDPRYAEVAGDEMQSMMLIDAAVYLPDDILVKVDRTSMAVSLEARGPLLDYRLFELAWRIPLDLKRREGTGKWILRQLAYNLVPRELLDRPKTGFAIPMAEWLRGPLGEWAGDLLNPDTLRREGWLRPGPIGAAWEAHRSGQTDQASRLWAVLMFQSWLRDSRKPAFVAA